MQKVVVFGACSQVESKGDSGRLGVKKKLTQNRPKREAFNPKTPKLLSKMVHVFHFLEDLGLPSGSRTKRAFQQRWVIYRPSFSKCSGAGSWASF